MTVELSFWIHPALGVQHKVDISEFYAGRKVDQVIAQARSSWNGDFGGRPNLALEIRALLVTFQPDSRTTSSWKYDFRTLYRFLDTLDPDGKIDSVAKLSDFHGSLLAQSLSKSPLMYGRLKTHIDRMRALGILEPLVWPPRPRDQIAQTGQVDPASIKRLYTAMKREGMEIKSMFRDGEALAKIGEDPRGRQGAPGTAYWERRANHAWLIRELTERRLLTRGEFYKAGGRGLNSSNDPTTQSFSGPTYLAPLMSERGHDGIVGKLRWFHPSNHDTAIFLWLFLIGTGWNLSTALALDISSAERWHEAHPQKSEFEIIHAFKGRAGRHQFFPSLAKPEWHPFQIITFMINLTAPIRRTARHRIELLRAQTEEQSSPAIEREIHRLEAVAASPWAYHVVNEVGEVATFSHADAA